MRGRIADCLHRMGWPLVGREGPVYRARGSRGVTAMINPIAALALLGVALQAVAQAPPSSAPTAEQDHQQMLDQLGIRKLRPGRVNDVNAPLNPVNYDEAKANPYPVYPDPLTYTNGAKVKSASDWWNQRRPELVEIFEHEIYGRIPASAPKVTWTVQTVDHEALGFTPITATRVIGHVDNSADPNINVDIQMMLVKPARAKLPMPVLIIFQFGPLAFPAPNPPSPVELTHLNEVW